MPPMDFTVNHSLSRRRILLVHLSSCEGIHIGAIGIVRVVRKTVDAERTSTQSFFVAPAIVLKPHVMRCPRGRLTKMYKSGAQRLYHHEGRFRPTENCFPGFPSPGGYPPLLFPANAKSDVLMTPIPRLSGCCADHNSM